MDGIEAVIGRDGFAKIGQPTRQEDPHAPDLWLAAKSGYSFSDSHAGDAVVSRRASRAGTHGYLPGDPDMLGALVISGYGVQPGTTLGRISNLTVAPAIAALLGVPFPSAEGKPLREIFATEGGAKAP